MRGGSEGAVEAPSDHDGGYEYALVVLGATIAQALLGAGAFTFKK